MDNNQAEKVILSDLIKEFSGIGVKLVVKVDKDGVKNFLFKIEEKNDAHARKNKNGR